MSSSVICSVSLISDCSEDCAAPATPTAAAPDAAAASAMVAAATVFTIATVTSATTATAATTLTPIIMAFLFFFIKFPNLLQALLNPPCFLKQRFACTLRKLESARKLAEGTIFFSLKRF